MQGQGYRKVKLFEQDTPLIGTVHFLFFFWGGGDLEKKNIALKGGGGENTVGLKGGSPTKFLKFCRDGICNNVNSLPECQKPAFLTFRKFKFSGGSMLLDLLCYAQKAILSH